MTEIYNGEAPFQEHSDTSRAAAHSMKKSIGPLHTKVLGMLAQSPATDEEMCDGLGLGGSTLRPRRRELQLMGRVEDSGQRRLTRSTRSAVVWRLVTKLPQR